MDFSTTEWILIIAIFVWSGFVRTAIGFGGAALSMPLLLLIRDDPLLFLPIVAWHLLIFSSTTAVGRLKHIDWGFVKRSMGWMLPKLLGVIGLISLPARWMAIFVFAITAFYAIAWILKRDFRGDSKWWDRGLLVIRWLCQWCFIGWRAINCCGGHQGSGVNCLSRYLVCDLVLARADQDGGLCHL